MENTISSAGAEEHFFTIQFEGVSEADASRLAGELQTVLQNNEIPELTVKPGQKDKNSQVIGETLIVGILGTSAVKELVRVLGDWLPKRNSKITVTGPKGTVVAENIRSKDAVILVEKMTRYLNENS